MDISAVETFCKIVEQLASLARRQKRTKILRKERQLDFSFRDQKCPRWLRTTHFIHRNSPCKSMNLVTYKNQLHTVHFFQVSSVGLFNLHFEPLQQRILKASMIFTVYMHRNSLSKFHVLLTLSYYLIQASNSMKNFQACRKRDVSPFKVIFFSSHLCLLFSNSDLLESLPHNSASDLPTICATTEEMFAKRRKGIFIKKGARSDRYRFSVPRTSRSASLITQFSQIRHHSTHCQDYHMCLSGENFSCFPFQYNSLDFCFLFVFYQALYHTNFKSLSGGSCFLKLPCCLPHSVDCMHDCVHSFATEKTKQSKI